MSPTKKNKRTGFYFNSDLKHVCKGRFEEQVSGYEDAFLSHTIVFFVELKLKIRAWLNWNVSLQHKSIGWTLNVG